MEKEKVEEGRRWISALLPHDLHKKCKQPIQIEGEKKRRKVGEKKACSSFLLFSHRSNTFSPPSPPPPCLTAVLAQPENIFSAGTRAKERGMLGKRERGSCEKKP